MSEYVTMEDFISSKQSIYLSYEFLSLFDKTNSLQFVSFNMLNDYIDDIKQMTQNLKLNDTQFNKYKYKPKLLCHDLYGAKELYFIILALNDMVSPKDFTRNPIKMLDVQTMEDLVTHLIKAEKSTKIKNNSEMKNKD